ncbi:hypothetical protein DITRI_Ditri02bG0145600 [Diplodiscus trichospermus]
MKKRSREKANVGDVGEAVQTVENLVTTKERKKDKSSKKKSKAHASVGIVNKPGGEDADHLQKQTGKSKDRKRKKIHSSSRESGQLMEKSKPADQDEVYEIPSGDEDCSKGMKKWLTEYHQSRPGLKVLQQRIDEFIIEYEAKLEQERKEKEARLTEGGWTLVEHHKGRKKTTDTESGTTVGSVSQTAVEENLAKKKSKEVSDFYRFQKREAQRNELMMLQSKFEQDKKRIQQLRAARKFRPY